MPWEVKKIGDKYCVVKKGTNEPVKGGCHDTREEAEKHKFAIEINYYGEPGTKKKKK